MNKLKLYRVTPKINKESKMSFNARQAADQLLAIADHIERQAALNSFFVCDCCNKVASLEDINSTRARYASEHSGISSVRPVTISDTVSCTSCHGDMKYAATEGSEKFFITAADDEDEDEDEEVDFGELDDTSEDGGKEDESGDVAKDTDTSDDEEEFGEDDGDSEDEDSKVEEPKSSTQKDTKKTDDKVTMREEPKAQFGDEDKKTRAKTAFDRAVERYSL